MKKITLMLITMVFAIASYAQGIKFEQNSTWEQVKEKAKAEHKFIFMDIYATWCGPCKHMDNKVYVLQDVGEAVNPNFISVKVQMDSTKADDEHVRVWYATSNEIKQKYNISSLPTYLFFSPEGKLVHRFSGAMEKPDFLKITEDATKPDRQYYILLDQYKQGKKDYSTMRYLATLEKDNGNKMLANKIARDYIGNFLNKSSDRVLLDKKNLEFAIAFSELLTSRDKYFALFYTKGSKVDEVMTDYIDLANRFVQQIITKEEIDTRLWPKNKAVPFAPDWEKLTRLIVKKYDLKNAERVVLNAQLKWYNQKKDWKNIVKYSVHEIDKYGVDTTDWGRMGLNNMIYEIIFKHSNDSIALNKAIKWMELINGIELTSSHLDTYACLLYKIGRCNEAIACEEKALKMNQDIAVKNKQKPDPNYQKILGLMKERKPIWDMDL